MFNFVFYTNMNIDIIRKNQKELAVVQRFEAWITWQNFSFH